MSKHILEIFSKYQPGDNSRAVLMLSTDNRVKYDRERRIVEMELWFDTLVEKRDLYEIEAELCSAYSMNYVKILPKYPIELLGYDYIPQVLIETERAGVVARGFFSDYSYEFDGCTLTIDLHTHQGGVDLVNDYKTPQVIERIIYSEFGANVKVNIVCTSPTIGYSDFILREYEAIDNELAQISKNYDPGKSYDPGKPRKSSQNEEVTEDTNEVPALPRVTSLYSVPDVPIDQDENTDIYDSGCRKFDISAPEYVYGNEFDVKPVRIAKITNPQHNIVIVGDVFDFRKEQTRAGNKFNIAFSLTDYNSSIDVRCFGVEADEADLICSFVANGATLALHGSVRRETRRDNTISEELLNIFITEGIVVKD